MLMIEEGVNWASYAQVYDFMTENNPAYGEILDRFDVVASTWEPKPGATLLDLGCGTGNFTLLLANRFPECQVIGVDRSTEMLSLAAAKADAQSLRNITLRQADLDEFQMSDSSVAGITCVHALYPLKHPCEFVRRLADWLQPGAQVHACDVGVPLRISDWSVFLFQSIRRRYGLLTALSTFVRGREVAVQNRAIAKAQRNGIYWRHDEAEFKRAFTSAGLDVRDLRTLYRGYSHAVVAQRPLPGARMPTPDRGDHRP